VDALYNGLEETSRTIEDLKIHLKDHLENADKRAKSVERHCEKLELTARELDAKVSSLPDIEDNLGQLSELPLSLEAISNELEGYKEELETLQQMARNVEGCLDSTVIEKLQGLNRHLDDLSAGVAGKNAEVSAAAKRVQEVTEKLDVVENEINALSSKFEGDILDQVVALELSAVQGRFESLQVKYTCMILLTFHTLRDSLCTLEY
jgi:chromosome segregation ATPase